MRELERGVGARTVHSRLAHLAALGDYLVKHRLLPENPLDHVERPCFKKRPTKFLFPEKVKALLAADRPEHERVALALFLDTMLRVSELVRASVGDLEQTEGDTFLRVIVKECEERRVPISREVAEQVHVFLNGRGDLTRSAPLLVNSRNSTMRP
jgi:site-specific recombinase XerD